MERRQVRVAWLTPVLGINGQLLYWQPLLDHFCRKFAEFQVFTSEFQGDGATLAFKVARCGSFTRMYRDERSNVTGRDSYVGGIGISSPAVLAAITRYRPDLLILNEFSLFSFYGLLTRLVPPSKKVLLIVECRPRTSGPWLLQWFRLGLRRLIAKNAHAVLTNNKDGATYLTEELHVPASRILCRPYLVSRPSGGPDGGVKPLRRSEQHGRAGPVRFLYVGQLIERKGLQYALKAFASILPNYRKRFLFEIVGDGPFRPELESLVAELDLSDHTVFQGRQPYELLTGYYSRADVLLFPTLSDYRSLVPFEAMSLGMPILASVRDGGISETVADGQNGFAFDPYDVEHLGSLIGLFIDDPGLIDRFSKSSLEMASAYTLEYAVDTLVMAADKALQA